MFYLGDSKSPYAIMKYGDIKDYLTEEFWSQYNIWHTSRCTSSLPLDPVWGKNPQYLIDIITAFQGVYESVRR